MEWWMWLLLILVLLSLFVLIVLLILWSRRAEEGKAAIDQQKGSTTNATEATLEETTQEPIAEDEQTAAESATKGAMRLSSEIPETVSVGEPQDDLKIIEGIGPKIASVFQAAGITTFDQLAAAEVDELRRILVEADIRLGDPTTWPEQARLAANAQWEELTSLQDRLKGGRRV